MCSHYVVKSDLDDQQTHLWLIWSSYVLVIVNGFVQSPIYTSGLKYLS